MELGNLEDEAKKRRERLQSLKRKREDNVEGHEEAPTSALPKPIFRSHVPKDESLKENVLERIRAESVEEAIKEHLSENKSEEPLIEEVDLTNLAPRKPDWDLKRDISKKLEKLERRTKRAIAEITRNQLKASAASASGAELAGAVNTAEQQAAADDAEY